jgi:hypothetical protein
MLHLGLLAVLSLTVTSSLAYSGPAKNTAAPPQERTIEQFLHGTDAERDAMLKDVAKSISDSGYREVQLVPWVVMMAKNAKGVDVMLLVDPVSHVALEIDNGSGERDAAAASETVIPKLRN